MGSVGYKECLEGGTLRTQCSLGDRENAKELLHEIHHRLSAFIARMRDKYRNDPVHWGYVANMMEHYHMDAIQETHPQRPGETSYVVGNGEIFSLCIRHLVGGSYTYHDLNTLMFVSLHELTHLASNDVNHEDIFWRVFRWILMEADEMGIYDLVDYSRYPVMYCDKIKIDYSPAFNGSWMLPR